MPANKVHKKDVRVGAVYAVKVSGSIVPVRLDAEDKIRISVLKGTIRNTWLGTNLRTNREIRIRSAAKLRYELVKCMKKDCKRWVQLTEAGSRTCRECTRKEDLALLDSVTQELKP